MYTLYKYNIFPYNLVKLYCTSIIFSIITLKTRAHIAQVQCHSLLYIKFDEFLPLFMPEKNHMIAGIVTKVLLNPKVQTHCKAICGLKLTPHFTLFDPAKLS